MVELTIATHRIQTLEVHPGIAKTALTTPSNQTDYRTHLALSEVVRAGKSD